MATKKPTTPRTTAPKTTKPTAAKTTRTAPKTAAKTTKVMTDEEKAVIEQETQLFETAKNKFQALGLTLKKKGKKFVATIEGTDEIYETAQAAVDWSERNEASLLEFLNEDSKEIKSELLDESFKAVPELVNEVNALDAALDIQVKPQQTTAVVEAKIEEAEEIETPPTIDDFKQTIEAIFSKKSQDSYRPDLQASTSGDNPLSFDLEGAAKYLQLDLTNNPNPTFSVMVAAAKRGYIIKMKEGVISLC